MITAVNSFFRWLASSFDNSSKGSSAKKLSSFAFMLLICYVHSHCNLVNAIEFLIADIGALLGLLGVASWEKLKTKKDAEPAEVS